MILNKKNIQKINPNIEKKTLSFISQISHKKSNEIFFDNNIDKITWDEYYLAEKKVLVSDERRVGSPAVDADLQLTNARPNRTA